MGHDGLMAAMPLADAHGLPCRAVDGPSYFAARSTLRRCKEPIFSEVALSGKSGKMILLLFGMLPKIAGGYLLVVPRSTAKYFGFRQRYTRALYKVIDTVKNFKSFDKNTVVKA
jgi:hypothetical protein